jgi:RNA polymerase primary sigma factor
VEARENATGGDREVRRLVEANMPFVFRVARQYQNVGIPLEDLRNEGIVGLIEAAHRYDPDRGTKFSTYAVWWIRRSILKALTEQSRLVKVPEYQTRRLREVREAESSLRLTLGRAPGRDEVSRKVGGGLRAVQAALRIPTREISLSTVVATDGRGTSLGETLVDRTTPTPEQRLLTLEGRRQLRSALARLTDRERLVLVHRFGLGGGSCLSLLETGTAMGMSRERVRQIQDRAVGRMRRTLLRRFVASPSRRSYPDPIGTEKKGTPLAASPDFCWILQRGE